MAQSNALRVRSVSRGSICYLQLFGTVDESFDPNLLLGEATGRKVILNLRAVSRLSSFGVREWTNAMRELCKKVERVHLVECSPAVVTQLNMVANFAGSSQILSVQAPFYCELCGWETDITVHLEHGRQVALPEVQCEQCTAAMTFDDDPDTYFSFPLQASASEQGVDPAIIAFIRHLGDDSQPDAAAEKEPRTVVGIDAVPQSSQRPTGSGVSQGGQRHTQIPREAPPTFMSKARPIMIGLAIPAVVATVIAISWPSSDDLSEQDRSIYTEHLSAERFEDAKAMIERLQREKAIGGERAKQYQDEIIARALAGYGEHLVAGQFEESANLVTRLAEEKVLPPAEGTRLHREISKTALGKYRDLVADRKYAEAEAVAKPLERKGVLPPGIRANFTAELGRERERNHSQCKRDLMKFVKERKWEDAIDASKAAALFGPLDTEMILARKEAEKALNIQQ